jgi:mono/diheme cytochrome c family protein
MAEIPNFTDSSWQKKRSDAQLLVSVLEGKDRDMPSWNGKLSVDQARGLVAHVRTFAPTLGNAVGGSHETFPERFHRLQGQFDQLQRESNELTQESSAGEDVTPSQSPPQVSPQPLTTATRQLYRQHCMKCHGADGTGKPARGLMAQIPNFADSSWQKKRSDAQLLASILEGKESDMPAWRSKISAEQARGLVAQVRAFAPSPRSATTARTPRDNRPR